MKAGTQRAPREGRNTEENRGEKRRSCLSRTSAKRRALPAPPCCLPSSVLLSFLCALCVPALRYLPYHPSPREAPMPWLRITDALKSQPGPKVTVKGWVRTRRDSKADGGLSYIAVHDGTCFDAIQVVARATLPNYQPEIARLSAGCAVEVDGALVASQGKGQSVEIQADEVRIVGWVENPDAYPVAKKGHTFEYLRDIAHLRPRTNTFGAVARVRHTLSMAVHRFFHERGYYYVHTPIITGSDCEGAGQMFRVSTLDIMNLPKGGAPGGTPAALSGHVHAGALAHAMGHGASKATPRDAAVARSEEHTSELQSRGLISY